MTGWRAIGGPGAPSGGVGRGVRGGVGRDGSGALTGEVNVRFGDRRHDFLHTLRTHDGPVPDASRPPVLPAAGDGRSDSEHGESTSDCVRLAMRDVKRLPVASM